MTRQLNTLRKGQILDLLAAQDDVPLLDGRLGVTTEAGEHYLASVASLDGYPVGTRIFNRTNTSWYEKVSDRRWQGHYRGDVEGSTFRAPKWDTILRERVDAGFAFIIEGSN